MNIITLPIKKKEIVFLTFGGPTSNYHKRVLELTTQAKKSNFFTKVYGYTEQFLKNDPLFWGQNGPFILNSKRGYGYWIWKPYIIQKTLQNMNENDILIYADAGCHLNFFMPSNNYVFNSYNTQSMERLNEYIKIVDNSNYGILSFQMEHSEYKYTKPYTLYSLCDNVDDATSGQCMASVIILRKNTHTKHLINEWCKYSQLHNYINDYNILHEQLLERNKHDHPLRHRVHL